MRLARVILIAFGVLVLLLGVVVLFETNTLKKIAGLAAWLILALIVHDGIIAGITFATALTLRKAGRKVPTAVLAIVQGALVIAAVFAIVVVPEVYKKSIGTKNPTVLPLDYGPTLLGFWGVLAALTVVGIALYLVRARMRRGSSLVE
ncbi:hypothetical protein [Lacisediminihabitans changchengi]|uniref:Uncharacterized protein n=1 Tax=Lacisediminihabitans changchengi TaxID=2787634 RepID=A0A934W468_9MICO|nr:hypothetical protein [Lacisediminihabitans changchengi]MBK4347190.1 hypothetical protein [Lacisediminihabitans changchengi]